MRSKSLLVKLIIFGSIFSILPVVIIGSFSYIQSSNQVQKQNNLAELQLLKQVNANIEQIMMTVDLTLTNLLESTVMDDAIYSKLQADDFQLYHNLRKEITHLQSFDTKVNEVIMLNTRENWFIRNGGIQRFDEHPDHEKFMEFFKLQDVSTWLLLKNNEFRELMPYTSCEYSISTVRKFPHYRTEKYGLAIVTIPACSVAEMIADGEGSGELMIIDEHQRIIVHRDSRRIGTSLSEHPVFADEVEFTEPFGQMEISSEQGSYAVTYHNSKFNQWTYLSVVSIDQLTQESRQIGWLTMAVSVTIITISIVFVWLISRRLYSPVNRLVESIQDSASISREKPKNEMQLIETYIQDLFSSKSKLEHEMREHVQQVRFLFLSRLYNGTLRPAEIQEKLELYDLTDQVNRWKSMKVLTLQVDTLDNTHYEARDRDLLLFAVSNIVEETVARSDRLPIMWLDQTLVILRGYEQTDPNDVREAVYELTESLKSLVEHYLQLSISIGISSIFHDIGQAHRAYEEGLEALKHRMILGKGVIIPYNSVDTGKPVFVYEYPARIEQELVDAIKIANVEEARTLLGQWMREALHGNLSPNDYQIAMMRLLNRLLILKQETGIRFEQLGIHKSSLYNEVLSIHTSEEIAEWFLERLILPLIQVFNERRDSQYHSLSEQVIDMIHQFAEEDISLESCAEKLHYNASYLSSVFKNETGYSFSEYVANHRLQIAKKWLVETDVTIKEIAERLQYSNSHNFIRSFRKLEGMTPGQYRSKYKP